MESKTEKNVSLFAQEKKERQVQLLKHILDNENAEFDRVVGTFSFKWGLRSSTVEKYLDELEKAGLIEISIQTPYTVKITKAGIEVLNEEEANYDRRNEGT
jgi:DNA-binding MarR family transcriptional regulator